VLERVADELGIRRPAGAHRLHAQVQLRGDFRGLLSRADQLEDLPFPVGQLLVRSPRDIIFDIRRKPFGSRTSSPPRPGMEMSRITT